MVNAEKKLGVRLAMVPPKEIIFKLDLFVK